MEQLKRLPLSSTITMCFVHHSLPNRVNLNSHQGSRYSAFASTEDRAVHIMIHVAELAS